MTGHSMKIRKRIFPRTIQDLVATLFLSICIPIVFWFELFIVLPEFHEFGSFFYNFTFFAAAFLVFNIKSNMLAIMLCDTSIKGEILAVPEKEDHKALWRLCSVCETIAPPRSWHCNTCRTCILKRDHHCFFTGCCIGHRNHRYFMFLVLFLFIGTAYASIYNNIFIWWIHNDQYANWSTCLKMVFPLFILTLDVSYGNYYLAIYEITMIGAAISLMLLIYHGGIIMRGSIIHERNSTDYNLGWKKNLEMVMGKRWYLTWISPFVISELPHDGIHWEEIRFDSSKNR